MTSTLNAKARAKLDKLKSSRPASARAAGLETATPAAPPLYYDRNKQFHSDADLEFGNDERVFGRTGALGDTSALAKRTEERGGAIDPRRRRRRRRPRRIARLAFARSRRPRSRRGSCSAKRFVFRRRSRETQ